MTVYSTSELTLRYVTVNLLLGSVYFQHRLLRGDLVVDRAAHEGSSPYCDPFLGGGGCTALMWEANA